MVLLKFCVGVVCFLFIFLFSIATESLLVLLCVETGLVSLLP